MRSARAMLVLIGALIGLIIVVFTRDRVDGVAFLFFIIAAIALTMVLYFRELERMEHNQRKQDRIERFRRNKEQDNGTN